MKRINLVPLVLALVLTLTIACTMAQKTVDDIYVLDSSKYYEAFNDDMPSGYKECMCIEGQFDRMTHFYVVLTEGTTDIRVGTFQYPPTSQYTSSYDSEAQIDKVAVKVYRDKKAAKKAFPATPGLNVIKADHVEILADKIKGDTRRSYSLYAEDLCRTDECLVPLGVEQKAWLGDLYISPKSTTLKIRARGIWPTFSKENGFLEIIPLGDGETMLLPKAVERTLPMEEDFQSIEILDRVPQLSK